MGVIHEQLGLSEAAAARVRVLVLTGYGLNCEAETVAAFTMLGAKVRLVHVADVIAAGGEPLEAADLLVFIGGFSFGDHIGSGRVYANRLRYRLGDALARFVDDGRFVLGICNGFQTIAKLGLVPGFSREGVSSLPTPVVSLAMNDRHGYRDAWVRLRVDPDSPCVFTQGLDAIVEVPARHGEGKIVCRDEGVLARIERDHLVPVRYVDADGRPTTAWPENPNGSPGGMAGLCDESGRVFGLMPHPEAYIYPENHPDWLRQRDAGQLPAFGLGLTLLAGGVRAAASRQ